MAVITVSNSRLFCLPRMEGLGLLHLLVVVVVVVVMFGFSLLGNLKFGLF